MSLRVWDFAVWAHEDWGALTVGTLAFAKVYRSWGFAFGGWFHFTCLGSGYTPFYTFGLQIGCASREIYCSYFSINVTVYVAVLVEKLIAVLIVTVADHALFMVRIFVKLLLP